jgi:hypothetical protein
MPPARRRAGKQCGAVAGPSAINRVAGSWMSEWPSGGGCSPWFLSGFLLTQDFSQSKKGPVPCENRPFCSMGCQQIDRENSSIFKNRLFAP